MQLEVKGAPVQEDARLEDPKFLMEVRSAAELATGAHRCLAPGGIVDRAAYRCDLVLVKRSDLWAARSCTRWPSQCDLLVESGRGE